MPTDMDALQRRIELAISERNGGTATVRTLEKMPGGACQDNVALELLLEGGAVSGERRMVLRSDASTSLPGSLDRAHEYEVVCAAVAAGVLTPAARWPARDLLRQGASSYFMDWAEGDAIGRKIVAHPRLEAARASLPGALAVELARIHSITPTTHPALFADPGGERTSTGMRAATGTATSDPAETTLCLLREMIDRLSEPRPALELVLRWLDENRPADTEVTLVHGDFRTGNFMVTPAGLSAILDWEFARYSSPLEDLAWITVRDWRFGRLDRPVGGFARRAPFYDAYERASGRTISRRDLHYWEVMGNARWAAGSLHQGERYRSGERDIELIAIARRAVEMEFEALRLIDEGPLGLTGQRGAAHV